MFYLFKVCIAFAVILITGILSSFFALESYVNRNYEMMLVPFIFSIPICILLTNFLED